MLPSATCGSCGFRLPIANFPVSKADSDHRALAVCSPCLVDLYGSPEAVAKALEVRVSTEREDTSTRQHLSIASGVKRQHSTTDNNSRKRRQQAEPDPVSLECRICCEEKAFDEFVRHVTRYTRLHATELPTKCRPHLGHRAADGPVCKTCIGKSLVASVEVNAATAVGCFHCKAAWDPSYVQLYVPDDVFKVYSDGMFRGKVTERKNFLWCPNPKCESGGLTYKRGHGWPQVVCGECDTRACAVCKIDWHEGLSCALAKANRNYDEGELENLKRLEAMGARMCPRCHVVIEKNGGCPNMRCTGCNKPFNWELAERVVVVGSKQKADPQTALPTPPPSVSNEDKLCEFDAELVARTESAEKAEAEMKEKEKPTLHKRASRAIAKLRPVA